MRCEKSGHENRSGELISRAPFFRRRGTEEEIKLELQQRNGERKRYSVYVFMYAGKAYEIPTCLLKKALELPESEMEDFLYEKMWPAIEELEFAEELS